MRGLRRADVAVAGLLGALGFALVVQVSAARSDGPLATARSEDLVQILDDLANRDERLRQEIATLSRTDEQLTSGTGQVQAALAQARRRTQLLAVLAGTAPARGPGVVVTLTDPKGRVGAALLLDTVEELRDAGAEAMQVAGAGPGSDPGSALGSASGSGPGSDPRSASGSGPGSASGSAPGSASGVAVRVVASTALVDERGGVRVDGAVLRPPYRFTVLGEPATLDAALAIAGGVVDTVQQQGGRVTVVRSTDVDVAALHRLQLPRYARPVPAGS